MNVYFTGHLNVEREWKIAEQLLLAVFVFWWYHNDKTQRQFRTGAFQNIAVVALALVAVPVYLFRSRGAKRGLSAFVLFLAFVVTMLGALILGGAVGGYLAP